MAKKPKRNRRTFVVDGYEYQFRYDLPLVRDIKKQLGVHILTNEGVNEVCGDVISFAEYVWASVEAQADRHGVDEEDFIRALPDNLETVANRWLEAICDFFEQMGRQALAELARALVETERAERQDANRTMTRQTASAVMKRTQSQNANRRRKALEEILGDEENENETHGASSDS